MLSVLRLAGLKAPLRRLSSKGPALAVARPGLGPFCHGAPAWHSAPGKQAAFMQEQRTLP